MSDVSLGLDTFGDVNLDANGRMKSMDQVLRDVVEQAVLADELGLDFIGLGEHHRDDFAISAPEIVLAAIAGRTRQIKLGTAVTILSTDDPVRVFQRFSTLNAVSNGRAEPILGRGSFTESYGLFGIDLRDYDRLFEEKLDLFVRLLRAPVVTWQGETRSALADVTVYPPLAQPITTWIGVGGSPESVVRVARHDLQMMLAIIGGDPLRFKPYIDLYHRTAAQMGQASRPIGVHSPGFVAATDAAAQEAAWPHYQTMFRRIGAERGWPAPTKARFLEEVVHGAMFVGAPDTVARKIARTLKGLGVQRFDLKYATGPMPHAQLMTCLQLYGEQVVPMVRDILSQNA